jgi:hypothetical protein
MLRLYAVCDFFEGPISILEATGLVAAQFLLCKAIYSGSTRFILSHCVWLPGACTRSDWSLRRRPVPNRRRGSSGGLGVTRCAGRAFAYELTTYLADQILARPKGPMAQNY